MTTTLPSNLVLFSDPFIGAMVNSYLQSPLALEMEEHFTSLTWPKSREGASEEGETGKQVDWACSCRGRRRRWKGQLPPPLAWRGRACEAGPGVVGGLRQEVRRRHGTPRRTDGSSSKRRKNSGNMSFAFLPASLSSSSARGRQPRGGLVFVVFLGKMLNCICLVLLMLIQRLLCCCRFRSFRLRLPWWAVGNVLIGLTKPTLT